MDKKPRVLLFDYKNSNLWPSLVAFERPLRLLFTFWYEMPSALAASLWVGYQVLLFRQSTGRMFMPTVLPKTFLACAIFCALVTHSRLLATLLPLFPSLWLISYLLPSLGGSPKNTLATSTCTGIVLEDLFGLLETKKYPCKSLLPGYATPTPFAYLEYSFFTIPKLETIKCGHSHKRHSSII